MLAAPVACAASLSPEQAIAHVGEHSRVCGVVASAKYASQSRGEPTFLNLGRPYPKHVFTALIWGKDRPAFPDPPESLEGEAICVEGTIEVYRGRAQIIVESPEQITKSVGGR